jgi:serine/threonine protein kinase
MEWLKGDTLEERLAGRRLTSGDSVRIERDLAGSLGALHSRGIVHRDARCSRRA